MSDTEVLRVRIEGGVALVTIDHPPLQLVDGTFVAALARLLPALEADSAVRAVVFVSADPDFFLMHGDVHAISAACGRPPSAPGVNPAAAIFDAWRSSRLVSIGVLEGAARGGGAEFLTALDLRIATPGALLGQPELALGLIPGAGGTARLGRLVGRSRALHLMLTGADVDAPTAAAIGWVDEVVAAAAARDRALALARGIAALPAAAVAALKRVVDSALDDFGSGLLAESEANARLMADGVPVEPIRRFLAAGGQTRDGERGGFASLIAATFARDGIRPGA